MKIIKTYQFKLKPTKAHVQTFERWLGVCRMVYNMALEIKIETYKKRGISVSKWELQKQITDIRKDYDWVREVQVHTVQDVTDRLFRAYNNFFSRVKEKKKGKKIKAGYPKFAKKKRYCSFGFKGNEAKLHQSTCTVSLPKIGKVKYKKSQEVCGEIKHTNIIKKADGWYVSITVEKEHIPLPTGSKTTGVDLGLTTFATTASGKITNPKILYKNQKKLRIAQRAVERKKLGGNNREKSVHRLQLIHQKISNTRKDFLHKVSSKLISENQVIGIETLNIRGMMKNHHLAKAIADAGWGTLVSMLKYKGAWNERTVCQAKQFYPSSKQCNLCGWKLECLPLSVREWACPNCNAVHDRDENAENNLNKMAVGHTVSALRASEKSDGHCCASVPMATSKASAISQRIPNHL